MRLEPVYLVAPQPKPPSIPARRAFLLAGGMFVVGLGAGGAGAYFAGVGRSRSGDDARVLQPDGSEELDELRRLAVQAPIEELMAVGTTFLELLGNRHQSDAMMWRGADRIAEALLSDAARPNRRQLSRWLAQVIERSRSSEAQARRHLLSDLQEVG